jgi:predicted nucleotidyltransferase
MAPSVPLRYTSDEGMSMEYANSHQQVWEEVLARLVGACLSLYGERLVSLVVFGSVGRGTPRPDSDVDLLIIAEGLPNGRLRRVEEFGAVEESLRKALRAWRERGVSTCLSPVFKTPEEALQGSPLFLDMVEDAKILYDRRDFFAALLSALRERLAQLGARRIWHGDAWLWDLKPDYRPGEIFEL